jgi:hypothetical protein
VPQLIHSLQAPGLVTQPCAYNVGKNWFLKKFAFQTGQLVCRYVVVENIAAAEVNESIVEAEKSSKINLMRTSTMQRKVEVDSRAKALLSGLTVKGSDNLTPASAAGAGGGRGGAGVGDAGKRLSAPAEAGEEEEYYSDEDAMTKGGGDCFGGCFGAGGGKKDHAKRRGDESAGAKKNWEVGADSLPAIEVGLGSLKGKGV